MSRTRASILQERGARERKRYRIINDLETINEEEEPISEQVQAEIILESDAGNPTDDQKLDTKPEISKSRGRKRSADGDGEPVVTPASRRRQARRFSFGTSEEPRQEFGTSDEPREELPEEHATTAPQVEYLVERETPRENEEERSSENASADRTSVNLGEESVTNWQRFLRKEWGPQGTMLKVMKLVHRGVKPLTVKELVKRGPIGGGSERMVAATCFASLLKLKQHQFVVLHKDRTFAITDISLGSRVK